MKKRILALVATGAAVVAFTWGITAAVSAASPSRSVSVVASDIDWHP